MIIKIIKTIYLKIEFYEFILYLLIFLTFLIGVIQDILYKEIDFFLTLIEIFLYLLIDINYYKLMIIYILICIFYYIFTKFLEKYIGFGDIWYITLYFFNFQQVDILTKVFILYKALAIFIILHYIYLNKISKNLPFLPIIALSYLLILWNLICQI